MASSPEIICLNIWLPGVCVSVSLHKFSLRGGVICVWQVGTKCISGRAGDGSSKACSWKDVSHCTQLSDSFCTSFDYTESRFSGFNVLVMYVSLCWAAPKYHLKITIHQINHGEDSLHVAEQHDWACRADVLNRAGLVLQLRPPLADTHSEEPWLCWEALGPVRLRDVLFNLYKHLWPFGKLFCRSLWAGTVFH